MKSNLVEFGRIQSNDTPLSFWLKLVGCGLTGFDWAWTKVDGQGGQAAVEKGMADSR